MRRHITAMLVGITLLGALAVLPAASASPPPCYPTCSGPDARLGGIAINGRVAVGQHVPVRVAGRNIGDAGAKVFTGAGTDNGDIGPSPQSMFVRPGQRYNVYFNYIPSQPGPGHVRSCTVAEHDVDKSDGCGTVKTHVTG